MNKLSFIFLLGYHGCDQKVAEKPFSGEDFKSNQNDYDWLGPGACFWEADPLRGLDYARELIKLKRGPRVENPAVVGAVIDLGLCQDLTTFAEIRQAHDAYIRLKLDSKEAGWELPVNRRDSLRRKLDCAVIRYLHEVREAAKEPAIDTLKGVFVEGDSIYPESGFHEKTHAQDCVRNPECIKGIFRVPNRYLV